MSANSPEIGRRIRAGGIETNYHDVGSGAPVLLIHGSGPGVTAWANWRLVLPELAKTCRAIAPDMVGFGYTERPAGIEYSMEGWVDHAIGLLDIFAHDRGLVTDELAELRYQASIRPGFQESFSAMFPAPRQRWVDAMASAEADIRAIQHKTLVIHGRDDRVIPLGNSITLNRWIDDSQLHVFGRCGHWVQIEHSRDFNQLVANFLAD